MDAGLITLCVFQVSRLKKDLLSCSEERDSAQLDKELLSSRLKNLESDVDTRRGSHTDHSREIRQLEVCVCVHMKAVKFIKTELMIFSTVMDVVLRHKRNESGLFG